MKNALACLLVAAAFVTTWPAAATSTDVQWVIPGGKGEAVKALLGEVGFNRELEDSYRFSTIAIEADSIVFGLTRHSEDRGRLVVQHVSQAQSGDIVSKNLAIRIEGPVGDPVAQRLLAKAAGLVRDNDGIPIFVATAAEPEIARSEVERRPAERTEPLRATAEQSMSDATVQSLIALALAFLWWLFFLQRAGSFRFELDIKRAHVLPMTLQFILFLYWALYWMEVEDYVGIVAAQLVFAYLLEGGLGLARHGKWLLGLGPFPIVFSVNLFVWYMRGETWCGFAVIAVALMAKATLRRNGRHIFNPSALGISVLGLFYMLEMWQVGWGNTTLFTFVDVSHPLTAAPNMTELILLLAIVPQFRFPIVLISMSALLVMLALTDSFGGGNPLAIIRNNPLHPLWPPVFLAITLLATDPATIPKTQNGKLLFGCALGLLIALMSSIVNGSSGDDYFTKVMPIPLLNLLIHRFDRWGESLPETLGRPFQVRFNRIHMACFVVLTAVGLATTNVKQEGLENAHFYLEDRVRHLDLKSEKDRCVPNPAWCKPFSFADEAEIWWD